MKDEAEAGAAAGEQRRYQSHGFVIPEVSGRRVNMFYRL